MSKNKQVANHKHKSHDAVKMRLKRAAGHLNKVISMIEGEEKCINISQQLHAVVKALIEAKKNIIYDHIEHCLDVEGPTKAELEEFKEIAKYL